MTGQHTDHALRRPDDPCCGQLARAGQRASGRRLAADPAGVNARFGVEDLLVADLLHHPIGPVQRAHRLVVVDRIADLDRGGDGLGVHYLIAGEAILIGAV